MTIPQVDANATVTRETPSGQPQDNGIEDPKQTFLRLAIAAILVGGIGFIAVILILAPDQTRRILNPVAAITVAVVAWFLQRQGKFQASLAVLTFGIWATAVGIAVVTAGIRTPVVFSIPLIILFSGWLFGPRSAIGLAVLSVAVSLGLAVAESQQLLPPAPPTSPYMHWVIQSTIFFLAAVTIIYLLREHNRRIEEVRTLTAELAHERAEVAAAEALRRNRDLLDRTGRLAHVGGWELDIASRTLTWTDETFRIHDLDPASMPPLDRAIEFYPPEARTSIEAALKDAIESGNSYDIELPLDTATGRRIWVRTLGEPQFEGGRVVRISGAFQDITDQRAAAEALKQTLNNLQRTLEATGDGIFAYDGSDTSGKLLFANDRFFEIWKIPPEEAPKTGRAEIIAAARKLFIDPEAGVQRIKDILDLGVVHEDKVPLNDGRVLFRRSIPLLTGSQISRVWSFRDITAEERSKAELQASRDEAQRANAAKSEFLSRMSHELRTPMHAIMGMMALARRRMLDTQGLDQLDKAKKAADHLLSVINDILDISKIEAGRLELEQINFSLDDVLRNLVNLVGNRAAEKGIKLLIDKNLDGSGANLRGDPLRLGQILLNIVGNAIKFSDHGAIVVRIRRDEAAIDGTRLRFEVEDQGIGIDADKQERLFLAFEQADGSMTRKFGGTGLGLAISKRLVQMMAGEIGVDSRPGQGSTFWFTAWFGGTEMAPVYLPKPTETAEFRLRRDFSGARVLLADDEPMGREIIQILLTDIGLAIDLADDGARALDHARRQRYDLILMDMQMPNMNGIEATQAIRADSMNVTTPIVAMTANAFEEDRRTCLAAGMNDHVGKPVEAETLFLTVLHWLLQSRT